MKNYYEILEVDIHASKEIIDKAFKVLAKKYHPDTQDDSKKAWAEEQFKLLNEAYEVLSDETKRDEYTKELEFDKDSQLNALMLRNADLEIQLENLQIELENLRHSPTTQSSFYNNDYQNQAQFQKQAYTHPYTEPAQYETQKQEPVYYESYYHPIKNKLKNLIAFCITILIIAFVGLLLWKIPYTHKLLVDFYENNSVIKSIFNLFHW